MPLLSFLPLGTAAALALVSDVTAHAQGTLHDEREIHFAEVRQLTSASGENAEAYWSPDGFPMFSPDGQWLAFGSNRNQSAPGETDVYIARWLDAPAAAVTPAGTAPAGTASAAATAGTATTESAADRYLADIAWLADDAREGRGLGTAGLGEAAAWLEAQFETIGLEPAGDDGGYRQRFDVVVDVEQGGATAVAIGGEELGNGDFMVPGFSANADIAAPIVFAGWGIDSEEHGIDDYAAIDAEGRIVLVRRYTPEDGIFADEALRRRFGDLRYKAFTAREHGAVGLLVADLPINGDGDPETPLPRLRVDTGGDAGIPVAVIRRLWAERTLAADLDGRLATELVERTEAVNNIVGRVTATRRLPGAVLIGAHYDHLGYGGQGSLAPDSREPHNGADDNASGTAALLEAARVLSARRDELGRDVVFAAFAAEEPGLLGSTEFVREPPPGTAPAGLVAMLNMDMVGRLRNNRVAVLGSDSAVEWASLVEPICDMFAIGCQLGGDGYGPSDQTPFYAAGVPVLHFFTGAHEDYHKPADDVESINAGGGVRIANVVVQLAFDLTLTDGLSYKASEAPVPQGDVRGFGASLGTIPDYVGAPDGRPGMLIAGVRGGGPADRAGMQRGDRIVELAGREVRDIYDFMYVLQDVRPGEQGMVVFERGDERLERQVTFGTSTR